MGGRATDTAAPPRPPELPRGAERVALDPADFVQRVDNSYWPMTPGTVWIYREAEGDGEEQRVEVRVTHRRKRVLGIDATVVHDVVSKNGEVKEDTFDWYAQDRWGNVWYLGERTTEYRKGGASTEGSWEAGVDGAEPGVILPGRPRVGMAYRQEYYAGEAEDAGEILSLDGRVDVPYGSFDHVLVTKDFTPLEPDVIERKFYATGVGPILEATVSGGSARAELLRVGRGG